MSDQQNGGAKRPLTQVTEIHPVLVGMRRSLAVLSTIAVLATFYFAKDLVLPILLGLLLALTLSPVARFFGRLGVPHGLSAVLLIVLTATSIGGAVVFSAGTVNTWVASAPEIGATLKDKLSGISQTIEDVRDASEEVEEMAEGDATEPVQEVVKCKGARELHAA